MKNADKPINAILTQSPSLQNETSLGLTKREYFAGLAMQGLCAVSDKGTFETIEDMYNSVATHSVKIADELLKQLGTTQD